MTYTAGKVQELYRKLDKSDEGALVRFVDTFRDDERAGVRKVAETAQRRLLAVRREKDREEQMRTYEHQCEREGYSLICGIDEAGRGPLAGPVVAAAVILPKDCAVFGLNDSKQLSEKKRDELYDVIREKAIAVGVGIVGQDRIDKVRGTDAVPK